MSIRPMNKKIKMFEKLNIKNKNYQKLASQAILITPELKKKLEGSKTKYGTRFALLETYGFKGGKHLIEQLQKGLGKEFKLVLTHAPSKIDGNNIHIELLKFRSLNQSLFMSLYRETGNRAAMEFLSTEFPSKFKTSSTPIPNKKEVAKVMDNLSESIEALPKKQRKEIPEKILQLIENEDPNFVFQILTAVGGTSERFKLEVRELLRKIPKDKTSTKGLEELGDFMDKWNLHQITSLLSIVKSRLQTIATFEQMIHDDSTYEIKGDKSIHRVLEKSMWLVDDKYWIVSSNKSLREFIGKELENKDKQYAKKRPDFVCVNHGDRIIILEIKRPSIELKKEEMDQAELYLRLIKKYKAEKKSVEVILIGNKISEEAVDISEIRTAIKIQTYQDFLEKCRARYEQYLKVVEED